VSEREVQKDNFSVIVDIFELNRCTNPPCSWTSAYVPYYLQVINRTKVCIQTRLVAANELSFLRRFSWSVISKTRRRASTMEADDPPRHPRLERLRLTPESRVLASGTTMWIRPAQTSTTLITFPYSTRTAVTKEKWLLIPCSVPSRMAKMLGELVGQITVYCAKTQCIGILYL